MQDKKILNIAFAATANMIPFAVVTALSIKDKLNPEYDLNIYYLWAESSLSSKEEFINFTEHADFTLKQHNINISYIDVTEYMHLFKGQNIGQWGEDVSYSHYMYLLLPKVLPDTNKIIYLDTDMIVNCDLSEVYERDLGNHLLAMGAPRGQEDMGDDVANSGFVVLNLDLWRKENTFEILMDFGKTLEKSDFCDQNLLHQYFTKRHPDRLLLYEKELNVFPELFPEIPIDKIKILHYTGREYCKPSMDIEAKLRASHLWWYYARQTVFYEMFYTKSLDTLIQKRIECSFPYKFNTLYEQKLEEPLFQTKFNIMFAKKIDEPFFRGKFYNFFNKELNAYFDQTFYGKCKRTIRMIRLSLLNY